MTPSISASVGQAHMSPISSSPADASLCSVFQIASARRPQDVALRAHNSSDLLTWAQYRAAVEEIATGLHALGVRSGDTVGLMLSNRPEFHLVDTAALHLGATPFSIYNTSSEAQIEYLLGHAGCSVLVTEPQYAARVGAAATPALEELVVVGGEEGERTLEELRALDAPGFDFEASWRSVEPDALATLIYTSGTTGPPKGVELTHANVAFVLRSCDERFDLAGEGRCLSYLPTAHMADRIFGHYLQMATGWTLTTIADATELFAALPAIRPSWFLGVPRIWEKLRAALLARFAGAEPEVRDGFEAALTARLAKVRAEQAEEPVPAEAAAAWTASEAALFAPLRTSLGLADVRLLMTGAAPIAPAVHEFFMALGLPLGEGFGMSETGALGMTNPPGRIRVGSVGTAMPGTEARVADDGELLVRGPHVMRGYRNDPVQTAEAIDAEGWLHTGDVGSIDAEGYVRIVDRKKELIINAAGKNMSPVNIESALKSASPLIGQAAVIGDQRPYNVALLVLDPEMAGAFAAEHGLPDSSPAAVAAHPAIRERIATAVESANGQLSRVEQVKRYELLRAEWLADGDELTPTLKLKRHAIAEKYADRIDALYAEAQPAAGA